MVVFSENFLSEIADIRSSYIKQRFVFLSGKTMQRLLAALGVTEQDMALLQAMGNHLVDDPTLPFRQVRSAHFCIDPEQSQIYLSKPQPYILTKEEDFIRYDSGVVREFAEMEPESVQNPALQGLIVIKSLITHGLPVRPRMHLDYASLQTLCTVFAVRTITTSDQLGEPTLEGVHSDGVDHAMTVYLDSGNMTSNSGMVYIHDPCQETGRKWEDIDRTLVRKTIRYSHFLDSMLFFDHEHKHSVSPVQAANASCKATRDILIFFTRSPPKQNHPAYAYYSTIVHEQVPVSIDVPVGVRMAVEREVQELI